MAATTYRIKKHGPTFRLSTYLTAGGESGEVETPEVYSNFITATDALVAKAAVGTHEFVGTPVPGVAAVSYKKPLFAQDYLGTDII